MTAIILFNCNITGMTQSFQLQLFKYVIQNSMMIYKLLGEEDSVIVVAHQYWFKSVLFEVPVVSQSYYWICHALHTRPS